jgi:hypothetical protein
VRRWSVYAIAGIAVVAVAAPGVSDRDSFPLSNYPMFSYDRGRITSFDTAVGVDEQGRLSRLSPEEIAGGYEPMLAAETVSKAVRNGTADGLCSEIAARTRDDDVVRIEVVTETYDTVRWFDGEESPLDRTVHAACEVPTP